MKPVQTIKTSYSKSKLFHNLLLTQIELEIALMLLISQNIPPNVITLAEHQKMSDFQPSYRPGKTQLIACICNETVWSNKWGNHGFSETADLLTYPSETSEVSSWVCQYSPRREVVCENSFHEKVNNPVLLISFGKIFHTRI